MITGTTRPSSATTGMSSMHLPATDRPVAEQAPEDLRHLLVRHLRIGIERGPKSETRMHRLARGDGQPDGQTLPEELSRAAFGMRDMG